MPKPIPPQFLNDLTSLIMKLQSETNVVIHNSNLTYQPDDELDHMIVMLHLPQHLFDAYLEKITNEHDFINLSPQGRA